MIALSNGGSREEKARALLDPCADATIISLDLVRRLSCQLRRTNVRVTGVTGPAMDSAKHQAAVYISDTERRSSIRADAFVLRTIGIVTPSAVPSAEVSKVRRKLLLADPAFDQPGKIDIVLGADVYHRVIRAGTRRIGSLLAQNTAFGWTVMGTVPLLKSARGHTHAWALITSIQPRDDHNHEKLLSLMQRFWALEEVPSVRRVSAVDRECEEIFARGVRRTADGRYIVRLPLKLERKALLGGSLPQALSALTSMQRRMRSDPALREGYCNFMQEYERLGHMRPLTNEEACADSATAFYVPHHGIWQRSDGGTKLRVVFNASRASSTGISLNDALHSGPKLQGHIATIITRWRRHRFVFCADVQHMFRQILIHEEDANFQRIVWSPSPDLPVRHFALMTVTYGTACAPYLALRTMQQLGEDEGDRFPLARELLRTDLYMDDFLSGGPDLETSRRLRDQLIGLLRAGGFHLRKWVANEPDLLDDIPAEDRLRPDWVRLSTDGPVCELGIAWDPVADRLRFRSGSVEPPSRLTKRTALAELAGVFDPAGWLTPLTLVAKIIIQDLWRAKHEWDEELPACWLDRWMAFRGSIREAANLSIDRWFGGTPEREVQLHAFADASRRALAAVVYLRIIGEKGEITTNIVCAKSKLATIKGLLPTTERRARMTIPRLELRATLIAAQLLRTVADALSVPQASCYIWTDSAVALHWLRSDEPVGHDIVDNYVSHIQELATGVTLRHVPTSCNPADVASRGTDTAKLARHPLWWHGPAWLAQPASEWPPESEDAGRLASQPGNSVICAATWVEEDSLRPKATYIDRFSNLNSLLRATTRVIRLRRRKAVPPLSPVTVAELRHAFIVCSRLTQHHAFAEELAQLRQGDQIKGRNQVKSLEPFLDDDGVIRVGGRLDRSSLPYDERHPILLPGQSHLAQLVIRWAHERSLHGGFRATYARALQKAWITGAKVRIKRTHHGTTNGPSAPWLGYVALFVCVCTKAVHLELVGDLTTKSFLGALSRFIDRRGKPVEIWSDNGTNFRGAALELRRLLREAEIDWGLVEGELAKEGIVWKFIPPAAPHFGGLWEAGVKSMKRHLQRVTSPRRLTFEEFTTLLTSVEATLNSRPLVPLSGDLGDVDALTPSHFLIGTSATSYPQPLPADGRLDHVRHWELVQAMRGHFWARWSREYLNTLIQRPKWRKPQPNLQVGEFVVITDPSLLRPDGRWPLGRILATHPGPDGTVRTVTIKTASGEYVRPAVKLARLPISDVEHQTCPEGDES